MRRAAFTSAKIVYETNASNYSKSNKFIENETYDRDLIIVTITTRSEVSWMKTMNNRAQNWENLLFFSLGNLLKRK